MAKSAKNKKEVKEQPGFRRYIIWFWRSFAAGVGILILLFLLASWGVFGPMPTFEELENPKTNLASELISSDGKTLGKYYLSENRTPVAFSDLPQHLVDALVATEDERYYSHSGIDARGTIRAFAFLGRRGGASTITQQLAKLLFHGTSTKGWRRYTQKIKEWVIAIRLERQYTKNEIIAMYLNKQDFIFNAVGIRSASRIYFGKEPKDLKIEEAAVLVAMLKNPRQYNPHREISKKKSLMRRNQVFKQMEKNDYISKEEKDSLQQLPLKINFSPETHDEGLATYFREYVRNSFMKNWIRNNPKEDGSFYNLSLDGLKIYTTIDSRMQQYAEEAVIEHMKQLQAEFFVQNTAKRNPTAPFVGVTNEEIQNIYNRAMRQSERWRVMKEQGKTEKEIRASFTKKTDMTIFSWKGTIDTIMTPLDSIKYYKHFLRTGMMSMEPRTGHVKAWVGGTDYKHFKYDQVIQGARQAGSTFKPFVYATAIDQLHLSPCDSLPDVYHCIEANKYGNVEAWCPKNSNGEYSGEMKTLKNGLAESTNTITARLMDEVGPAPVVNLARKLGITSDILEVPSIALGTPDITVYEMVGAYGTFANQGVYVKPVMITRIEDKNGTVLFEYVPETRDVMSREVAYTTVNLMQGVADAGSGRRLRHDFAQNETVYKEIITGYPYKFDNPIAGKTGTTQNQSDGWFMGMVPNLVTGVWVGGEDRATHFKSITYGQGASMSLPIWALYMQKCYADAELGVSKEDFEKPEELTINVDCTKKPEKDKLNIDKDLDDLDF
ncbi:penicillin-binding protein [Leptobacterium flavescens]|uniref:Penicillin-binding protein n=1 Tax=Leptobacterium flavescens TaxID=472055 RepID=A0A6P0UL94_9FLAO|nr:transglycosylase domain-containing protein [Leptobacterium flavescens]NER13190.1 penicillin-binding protein [Leptobacterium flavescens]